MTQSLLYTVWETDKFLYLIFAVLLVRLRIFNISCFINNFHINFTSMEFTKF